MAANVRGPTEQATHRYRYVAELVNVFVSSLETNEWELASGWNGVLTATMAPSAIGIWVRSQ